MYRCVSWQQEVTEAMNRFRGTSMMARAGKLALEVTVYSVWQERNARIFQNTCRTEDSVLAEVQNYVIGKTCLWILS